MHASFQIARLGIVVPTAVNRRACLRSCGPFDISERPLPHRSLECQPADQ